MIERKIFDKVLKRFKKVIGCNGPIAALRCIKLDADGESLTISGTSGQVSAVEKIPAAFTGACCVNLKELMGALKGMNGNDISPGLAAESEGAGRLSILSADGSRCSLSIFPVDEFPTIISMDEGKECFTMAAEVLGGALKTCFPFVSDDETRPYINGIHMLSSGGALRMEASDGHRLIVEERIPCEKAVASNFILPRTAIPALIEKVNGGKGTVEVRGSESHIFFGFENGYIAARKTDAEFPPVASVIPENPVIACKVGRKEMLEAAKSAKAIATNGDSRSPAVQLHVAPESLKVVVDLAQSGGGFEKSLGCRANGWISIGFNPKYLADALKTLEADSVVLELTDTHTGAVLREGKITLVIMPIRLAKEELAVIETPIASILEEARKESAA